LNGVRESIVFEYNYTFAGNFEPILNNFVVISNSVGLGHGSQ
jgi:hypothetical protein